MEFKERTRLVRCANQWNIFWWLFGMMLPEWGTLNWSLRRERVLSHCNFHTPIEYLPQRRLNTQITDNRLKALLSSSKLLETHSVSGSNLPWVHGIQGIETIICTLCTAETSSGRSHSHAWDAAARNLRNSLNKSREAALSRPVVLPPIHPEKPRNCSKIFDKTPLARCRRTLTFVHFRMPATKCGR